MSSYNHHGVDWSPRYGARCPVCGVYTKKSLNRGEWLAGCGCRTRTHICPNPDCVDPATGERTRMKSVEKDPDKGAVPKPEDLRFLRGRRERGSGEAVGAG